MWWRVITALFCPDCRVGAVPVLNPHGWTWMCAPHAMTAVTGVSLRTEL